VGVPGKLLLAQSLEHVDGVEVLAGVIMGKIVGHAVVLEEVALMLPTVSVRAVKAREVSLAQRLAPLWETRMAGVLY
jgi:hypothetical protein